MDTVRSEEKITPPKEEETEGEKEKMNEEDTDEMLPSEKGLCQDMPCIKKVFPVNFQFCSYLKF